MNKKNEQRKTGYAIEKGELGNYAPISVDSEGYLQTPDGDKYTVQLPEVTVKPQQYRSAFDGSAENALNFLNAATAGAINRMSPSQNLRLGHDLYSALLGRKNLLDIANSAITGNNGIVSDTFAAKHPSLALAANTALDAAVIGSGWHALQPKSIGKQMIRQLDPASSADKITRTLYDVPAVAAGTYLGSKLDGFTSRRYGSNYPVFTTIFGGASGAVGNIGQRMAVDRFLRSQYESSLSGAPFVPGILHDIYYQPVTTTKNMFNNRYLLGETTKRQLSRHYKQLADQQDLSPYQNAPQKAMDVVAVPKAISPDYVGEPYKVFFKNYSNDNLGSTSHADKKIYMPLRTSYSNNPLYKNDTQLLGTLAHERLHDANRYSASLFSRYDPDIDYHVPLDKHSDKFKKIFENSRRYGKWFGSPGEVQAEYSNYLSQAGLGKTFFSDLDVATQKDFVKFISKRFHMREADAKYVMLEMDKDAKYAKQAEAFAKVPYPGNIY